MTTRIVVADQAAVRFYDIAQAGDPLRRVGEMTNPAARLHNRDLVSDRPGRVFDHAQGDLHRRGAVAHHATGGEDTPKHHESLTFASHIAQSLQSAQHAHAFDRLVLVAGPQFLGMLRAAMPAHLLSLVTAEVKKDLIHEPESTIPSHLPEGVPGSSRRPPH